MLCAKLCHAIKCNAMHQLSFDHCVVQMGHAAAEAVVAAGLTLVPFTLTGYSAGVAVSNVGIRGLPVELVGRERRQEVMGQILQQHPNLIVVDYTTPYCVNGEQQQGH